MKKLASIPLLQALLAASWPATLWLALACPTHAQWFNSPYRGMARVSWAPNVQDYPLTCALGGGNTLIAWQDYRLGTGMEFGQAYYQVLDSFGSPVWPEDGIPMLDGTWRFGAFGLMADGQGGAIVVFSDGRDSTWDVYGQRIDSLGNRLWGEEGLPLAIWSGTADETIGAFDLISDSVGNFFLALVVSNNNTLTDIYIQKFAADGTLLWGSYGAPICVGMPNAQSWPQIVPDQAGGVLAVWLDQRHQINVWMFYFQHLDAQGNPLLPLNGIPVVNSSGIQMGGGDLAEAIPDGLGGGIWASAGSDSPNSILLFRVNGQGRWLWGWSDSSPIYTNKWITGLLRHPADGTTWLSAGQLASPQGPPFYRLFRFGLQGQRLFGNRGVPYGGETLTATSDGVITCAGFQYLSSPTRVIANRVNSSGACVWQIPVVLNSSLSTIYPFTSATDGADGIAIALMVWRWQSGNGWDISAQRVQADGTLGSPVPPVRAAAPANQRQTLSVSQNIIHYELPSSGRVNLVLYNLLGQQVAVLDEGEHIAGAYTVPLELNQLPSGIYLLQLTTPAGAQTAKVALVR